MSRINKGKIQNKGEVEGAERAAVVGKPYKGRFRRCSNGRSGSEELRPDQPRLYVIE